MIPEMQIIPKKITDLLRYDRNARTHSDEQVRQIAESIKEFGFNNPVLIDENSTIIAGHGRFEAALQIGLETVPCLVLSHLSEIQRRSQWRSLRRLHPDLFCLAQQLEKGAMDDRKANGKKPFSIVGKGVLLEDIINDKQEIIPGFGEEYPPCQCGL